MWTDGNGFFYVGDCREGDRAATDAEVAAWQAARTDAVPTSVTNAQLKRWLDGAAKLAAAQTAVASAGGLTLELWYSSAVFLRTDPLLTGMATAIGLSSSDLDAAFIAASKL